MFKSYYFLNRYIISLRELLIGKTISSVFSQEKEKLIIQFADESILEFSVNPKEPFINYKDNFHRARKNTLDFFIFLNKSKVNEVLIASDDRIILLTTNKGNLYFTVRGQFTNVFCIRGEEIFSFKKEDEKKLEIFLKEFHDKVFITGFNYIDKSDITGKSIEKIRKEFPFVGKEIENEVKLRAKSESSDNSKEFLEVLSLIENEKPVLYFENISRIYSLGFDKMELYSGLAKEYFDYLISAFNAFLSKAYHQKQYVEKYKLIRSYLDKELKKVTSRLNNLNLVINRGPKEAEYNSLANLLLVNINKIRSGSEVIEVSDLFEENKFVKIKLDPKLTPDQNVKRYFDKARDDRISREKSIKLNYESKKHFDQLKKIEKQLEQAVSLTDLSLIMDELKIKNTGPTQQVKDDISSKFKHYIIENKYHVFVGKDSTNNDLLTTKFAKQNDFWFHARSVSGSHVILRVENTKEVVPKSILKKAASLAAFHSKSKTSSLAPVSYTLKKYVVKRKGMPVGQVSLLKEDVILVKPEIPKDCQFVAQDSMM